MLRIKFLNLKIPPIKEFVKAKLRKLPELNQFQLKELSKMFFNAALLCLGSLILKFFEPGVDLKFDGRVWAMLGSGLVMVILLVATALYFGSKVKKGFCYE